MELYLKTNLLLKTLAERIAMIALPGYEIQLRDGLNLGGGKYFNFHKEGSTILLVSNDTKHGEVFVASRETFPYYCYVREGSEEVLKNISLALSKNGIDCELANEA